MEIILNAGLGVGALMFLLLLVKKNKRQKDYFFLCWITATLLQITFYQITIYRFELHGFCAIAGFGLPLLGAPLLFLYILSLTGYNVTWPTIAAHLGVYVVFVGILFFLQEYHNVSLTASEGYLQLTSESPNWMQFYAVPLALSGLVYCVWDLFLLNRHNTNIADLFSFDEQISLHWLRYVVYSYFFLFILASFFIFGATQFQLFSISNSFTLVGILLSLTLIGFGFYGFRQTTIFSSMAFGEIGNRLPSNQTTPTAVYAKSGLDSKKIERLAKKLADYMDQEKPFLNENLSLPLLAKDFGIPQAQLSQVINQHFRINFFDFVNRYRVEEAKRKLALADFDHLTILGIAFDCGFKSKSSFNRYFKKYTGTAPSEFKRNLGK